MEKRFKFRHVNELTGLFVLAVLALVIAGAVFSGHSQRWFARKYAFDVLLPEAGAFGLRPGNDVFIAGVSVGWVDDVLPVNDGRMKARVKVRGDFGRFVRVDSTASIKKVFGVAGDSFIEITRGTNAPLPASGAFIVCLSVEELSARLERMLEELRGELMPVVKKAGTTLDEWAKLGSDLQQTGEKLHQLVVRLDHLAGDVEQGKGTAGKLLTDTALADQAQNLLARANDAMSGLQAVVTNLNTAMQSVQSGTARLPEITDAVAKEAKDLPGLVQQTQVSMRELERLVEAMQRHWLLRKYVNKTDPPPLRALPAGEEPPRQAVKVAGSPKDSSR
ncbi:MAG TPA: MlaD family protein [Candidatus Acidoferrum sp.]|jgi:phospholipid/cholesterol/gamma-HCH transport system substrate-binding protein|nr:MlaD family protein [Candidatus Acidoferrum sp.]